ncbi:MAG: hypothetical protein R2720_14705 [Candidatus Nanopelagicales bacterium]
MSIARRRITAVAAAAILIPSLSGCWSGFGAQTSEQANQAVGNGTNLATGDIEVRGATWVRNATNPTEATLVATFINNSDVPDRLVKVEITPVSPMGITGGALEVPTTGSVRTGYWSPDFINAFQLQAFPSTFVPTTFTFENAGTVTGDVMSVPNTGTYQGVVVSVVDQQKLQKFVDKTSTGTDTSSTEKVAKAKKKQEAAQE